MIAVVLPIRIPFHDVDVLTVAWHGHYVKYCELARTQLIQKLGLDWPELQRRNIVMPVVHFSCDYRSPLVYGADYEIEACVDDPLLPKFSVVYRFRRVGKSEILATAKTDQIYVHLENKELMFSLPTDLKNDIVRHLQTQGEIEKTVEPEAVFWRND